MSVQSSKKNLFPFFKSDDFATARYKMCAIYILLSYINELHEDVDNKLQGYKGLFIGDLKHASKEATKAFETYEKAYREYIDHNSMQLAEVTVDVTSSLDKTLEKNRYYLQQCYNLIANVLDKEIEEKVHDEEQLEKERFVAFQICGDEERKLAQRECERITRNRFKNDQQLDKIIQGVDIGFTVAVNWINRIYIES